MVFLTFIGLYFWVFPDTNVLDTGFADLQIFFLFAPVAFMLLIPAITMRTFAEEKKDGTIELLLTRPVTDWQIILGKYFASLTLVVFALIPTLVYYFTLSNLGNPQGNIDSAGVFTSYIGLVMLGAVFTSIGIFASSISNNQIVAFILSLLICYILYDGITRLASLEAFKGLGGIISQLGLDYQFNALSKGVIDSRNIIYFLGIIFLMLQGTGLVLGSRKWEA